MKQKVVNNCVIVTSTWNIWSYYYDTFIDWFKYVYYILVIYTSTVTIFTAFTHHVVVTCFTVMSAWISYTPTLASLRLIVFITQYRYQTIYLTIFHKTFCIYLQYIDKQKYEILRKISKRKYSDAYRLHNLF